jgi:pimeloyl-ACP methyl ester carboxylesterase
MADAGYVRVDGLDMYYERHGAGPPLVLLHGAMGTIESCFAGLLPRLAAVRQVIAVELQGHGHTADIDRPLSYEGMADDVAALVRDLDLGRVDIVGYSLGGAVAVQVAIRYPHLVRRIVAAGGTSYSPDGMHPELAAAFDEGPPVEELAGSPWHEAYLRVAPHPEAWPALVAKVNDLDRTFAGWPPEQIAAIEAPALLMIGDADIVRPEHTVEMFRLMGGGVLGDLVPLPPAQLAVLPGTTHVGMLDEVDWLASMITRFLDPPQAASAAT